MLQTTERSLNIFYNNGPTDLFFVIIVGCFNQSSMNEGSFNVGTVAFYEIVSILVICNSSVSALFGILEVLIYTVLVDRQWIYEFN